MIFFDRETESFKADFKRFFVVFEWRKVSRYANAFQQEKICPQDKLTNAKNRSCRSNPSEMLVLRAMAAQTKAKDSIKDNPSY